MNPIQERWLKATAETVREDYLWALDNATTREDLGYVEGLAQLFSAHFPDEPLPKRAPKQD